MKLMKLLGLIALVVLGIPTAVIINGFVVMKLWNWFMPHIFELRSISLVQAMAIALVARCLTIEDRHSHDERETKEKIMSAMGKIFLSPALCLLFGWIIKSML